MVAAKRIRTTNGYYFELLTAHVRVIYKCGDSLLPQAAATWSLRHAQGVGGRLWYVAWVETVYSLPDATAVREAKRLVPHLMIGFEKYVNVVAALGRVSAFSAFLSIPVKTN